MGFCQTVKCGAQVVGVVQWIQGTVPDLIVREHKSGKSPASTMRDFFTCVLKSTSTVTLERKTTNLHHQRTPEYRPRTQFSFVPHDINKFEVVACQGR